MSDRPIAVMLVDDSHLVRVGLRSVLNGAPDICVVAEAGSVAEAISVAAAAKPEVILLDLRLPDGSGLDACQRIRAHVSGAKFLVLTSVADEQKLDEAIKAGVQGYLLKEIDPVGLLRAIRSVAAGAHMLDPKVTGQVMNLARSVGQKQALLLLSPQERRVLASIALGKTNKEIGSQLGLSEKTVKNYLSSVFEKLHVSRRAEAAAWYVKETAPD